MTRIIWTIEKIHELALLCKTRTEFSNRFPNAYCAARKKFNCLDFVCSHMPHRSKSKWTKEVCAKLSLKYTNKTDFRLNESSAYEVALENKWMDEICKHMKNPNFKYTIEDCRKEALKYSSRIEFQRCSPNLYRIAWKYKWLDEICQHMSTKINQLNYPRIIYVYEFPDKSAYIGLTKHLRNRINSRRNRPNDSVTKYINETNLTPVLKILTDFVPVKEAQLLEEKFIGQYRFEGWNILNKVKGGGIGGGISFNFNNSKNKM